MIRAGLAGSPLKRSLSPRIFSILSSLGCEKYRYILRTNRGKGLGKFTGDMKKSVWNGFNVTIPLKEKILPWLDRVSPQARDIGAVNTVLIRNNRLEGFNTDADGIRLAMAEARFRPRGRTCVIWGAGGAARTAAWVLARGGAKIVFIHNRSFARAATLAKYLAKRFPRTSFKAVTFGATPAKESTVFVNATPLGMYAPIKPNLKFQGPPGSLYMDLAYAKGTTRFLENRKGGIVHGIDILIYQAIKSSELYSGRRINAREIVKLKDRIKAKLCY